MFWTDYDYDLGISLNYGYEIYNDGCCIRQAHGFYETEEEAREEAEMEIESILEDEGYENDTRDDFYIEITKSTRY